MDLNRKPVGNFFELELPKKGTLYHDSALALANGRVCFKVLLNRVKPTKVYVPFFCCDMLVLPLKELNIPFEFYPINMNLDPLGIPLLSNTELFVYVNYFGLKTQTARKLSRLLGEQLVVDNTQAFFEKSYGGTWTFNSIRKFFGVPDGGFLYSPLYLEDTFIPNKPHTIDHLWLSLCGNYDEADKYFQQSEAEQTTSLNGISELTKRILYGVDFPNVIRARKRHFRILDRAFREINLMPTTILDIERTAVPFCYPLLLKNPFQKAVLLEKSVFIPTLWMEILSRDTEGYEIEKSLTKNLLLLPVDHRLEISDLGHLIKTILEVENEMQKA